MPACPSITINSNMLSCENWSSCWRSNQFSIFLWGIFEAVCLRLLAFNLSDLCKKSFPSDSKILFLESLLDSVRGIALLDVGSDCPARLRVKLRLRQGSKSPI